MTAEQGSDATPEADEPAAGPSIVRRVVSGLPGLAATVRAQWRVILLAALTVATVGLAVGMFFLQYRPDRQLDDAAATQAVHAASAGAVAVLSYSSDTLDRDFADARTHLTGDFLSYYTTFSQGVVAPVVRDKHLVQKAVVTRAAVAQLGRTSAVVLAFVNESVMSADKKQPSITQNAVRVTLQKVDGTWLVSKLDPVS